MISRDRYSNVEVGIVKFYSNTRHFGFLTVMDNEGFFPLTDEIYFGGNDGKKLENTGDYARFSAMKQERRPKEGEHLVFHRFSQRGRLRAEPWGYRSEFDAIAEELENRPLYRVREVFKDFIHLKEGGDIVWMGKNIVELSSMYPKLDGGDDKLADIDDDDELHQYFFEKHDGVSWVACEDPRMFACCLPRPNKLCYHTGWLQPTCTHK